MSPKSPGTSSLSCTSFKSSFWSIESSKLKLQKSLLDLQRLLKFCVKVNFDTYAVINFNHRVRNLWEWYNVNFKTTVYINPDRYSKMGYHCTDRAGLLRIPRRGIYLSANITILSWTKNNLSDLCT